MKKAVFVLVTALLFAITAVSVGAQKGGHSLQVKCSTNQSVRDFHTDIKVEKPAEQPKIGGWKIPKIKVPAGIPDILKNPTKSLDDKLRAVDGIRSAVTGYTREGFYYTQVTVLPNRMKDWHLIEPHVVETIKSHYGGSWNILAPECAGAAAPMATDTKPSSTSENPGGSQQSSGEEYRAQVGCPNGPKGYMNLTLPPQLSVCEVADRAQHQRPIMKRFNSLKHVRTTGCHANQVGFEPVPNNGVYDYEGAKTEIAKALTDVYGGKWTVYAAPDCPADLGIAAGGSKSQYTLQITCHHRGSRFYLLGVGVPTTTPGDKSLIPYQQSAQELEAKLKAVTGAQITAGVQNGVVMVHVKALTPMPNPPDKALIDRVWSGLEPQVLKIIKEHYVSTWTELPLMSANMCYR